VSIPYTATDDLSGVAASTPGSPLSFAAEGANQTQSVTVTDAAGNSASFTSPAVSIDLTPPTTTAAPARPLSGGWYAGAVQVTLSAADALSGVAATYYSVDSSPPQAYSAP